MISNSDNPFKHSKTVLITGASSGIGLALAKIFAREVHSLVLIARNEERLKNLASELNVPVVILPKDLTNPSCPQEIYDELQKRDIGIDILVNNAGFGVHGSLVKTDLQKELEMIQVNMTALTHLTKLFLPPMIEKKYGKILNVASTAAFQPGPLMANYYATKAYVLSLSEALAFELKDTGVTVTTLCPGPTRTEFQIRADIAETLLFRSTIMDADRVAEIGYRGLMQGKRVVIPGIRNKILSIVSRLSPNSIVMPIVKKMQENR